MSDFYVLFAIPRHATQPLIKSAYHRLLLQSHPDKRPVNPVDLALIKHAYATLSNPHLRAAYDARLDLSPNQPSTPVPRPAQVVSLDDFQGPHHGQGPWSYPCRCGGAYTISTALMEHDNHLVACSTCSEVIWVAYEQLPDDPHQE